jgi:dienelactone hydrolase
MRLFVCLSLGLLGACSAPADDPAEPGDDDDDIAQGDDDDVDVEPGDDDDDDTDLPPENPFGDAGSLACPDFATGTVTLGVAGSDRTLRIELPDDPQGASVVFVWHWLGGNADEILDWMSMRDLARDGAIVVAPESTGLLFEWDFFDPSDGNPDLALFDASLTCLWEQHGIDPDRVYATGMSAGGLMTTFLTMHRADILAATAPFSGGAADADYVQPSAPLPVMVTWGGPTDTAVGYDFHTASVQFADRLEEDGHYVLRCMHALGHLPPVEAADMASRFFAAHSRGGSLPWTSAPPAELPAWCE